MRVPLTKTLLGVALTGEKPLDKDILRLLIGALNRRATGDLTAITEVHSMTPEGVYGL